MIAAAADAVDDRAGVVADVQEVVADAAAIAAGAAAAIATAADAGRAGNNHRRTRMHDRDVCRRRTSLPPLFFKIKVLLQSTITAPPLLLGGRMRNISGSMQRNSAESSQNTSLNDMIAACCWIMFSIAPFAIR